MSRLRKAQLEAASQIRVAVYDDPAASLPGMREFSTKHQIELARLLASAKKWTGADALAAVLEEAVKLYGKPGGPWNVPSDPGGWISKAHAALAKYRPLTDEVQK